MSFHPGDVVVCVSTRPNPEAQLNPWTLERLTEGAYYRVAKYLPNPRKPGLQLVGVDHSPGDGWHAWRFRKVVAADGKFIERLRVREFEPA